MPLFSNSPLIDVEKDSEDTIPLVNIRMSISNDNVSETLISVEGSLLIEGREAWTENWLQP